MLTPSPLPTLDSLRAQTFGENEIHAYNLILEAEKHASQQQIEEDIFFARVTGYLLLEFCAQTNIFGDKARDELVRWVMSPSHISGINQHKVIFGVGKLLLNKFICLFRASERPYPQPLVHPSGSSFDTMADMIKDTMESTADHYRATMRKVLARDGYRCIVTGIYDCNSLNHCVELEATAAREHILRLPIDPCHILNDSTMQTIDPYDDGLIAEEMCHAAGDLTILETFGFSDLTDEFKKPGGVHRVWNLLTLELNLRHFFSRLGLWFETTDKEHLYNVRTSYPSKHYLHRMSMRPTPHDGAEMVVEFTPHDNMPPPEPRLLALHATCARVAQKSGAFDYFSKLEEDMEGIDLE